MARRISDTVTGLAMVATASVIARVFEPPTPSTRGSGQPPPPRKTKFTKRAGIAVVVCLAVVAGGAVGGWFLQPTGAGWFFSGAAAIAVAAGGAVELANVVETENPVDLTVRGVFGTLAVLGAGYLLGITLYEANAPLTIVCERLRGEVLTCTPRR